jgi:hypothetical protein
MRYLFLLLVLALALPLTAFAQAEKINPDTGLYDFGVRFALAVDESVSPPPNITDARKFDDDAELDFVFELLYATSERTTITIAREQVIGDSNDRSVFKSRWRFGASIYF